VCGLRQPDGWRVMTADLRAAIDFNESTALSTLPPRRTPPAAGGVDPPVGAAISALAAT
jgi:hypothetical protein